MTTSKLVRRTVMGLLIALAILVNCVGRVESFNGGAWNGRETQRYGWPWVAYSGSTCWEMSGTVISPRKSIVYTHTRINSIQWLRSHTSYVSSTLFVIPAVCNFAWWGALIYLVHRALTPSPDSADKRGVTLRWSVRGLLVLQLLAALAIGLGDRW